MSLVEQLMDIWDTELVTPADLSIAEVVAFKKKSGSSTVVGAQWKSGEETHRVDQPAIVLPDRSAVVVCVRRQGSPDVLVVYNADGTKRFSLSTPVLDNEPSLKGSVRLELPRKGWATSGIDFGPIACWESRPQLPVMLKINWQTGQILGFEPLPRFF